MVTDITRLTQSPGPMKKHPHSGANYHDGEAIITHLNYALGPDGWDWEWVDQGLDAEADEVWVLGKLTARFVAHADADEGYKTTAATKTVKGWKAVSRKKNDKSIYQLGDDYKAADTDALKRAARLLGVGLDAWGAEVIQREEPRCDAAFFTRKWHATVKDSHLEDDATRAAFMGWYSGGATDSLSEWLKDATAEEAETLIATAKDRIAIKAQKASA
jgi:hypothetical protein